MLVYAPRRRWYDLLALGRKNTKKPKPKQKPKGPKGGKKGKKPPHRGGSWFW